MYDLFIPNINIVIYNPKNFFIQKNILHKILNSLKIGKITRAGKGGPGDPLPQEI